MSYIIKNEFIEKIKTVQCSSIRTPDLESLVTFFIQSFFLNSCTPVSKKIFERREKTGLMINKINLSLFSAEIENGRLGLWVLLDEKFKDIDNMKFNESSMGFFWGRVYEVTTEGSLNIINNHVGVWKSYERASKRMRNIYDKEKIENPFDPIGLFEERNGVPIIQERAISFLKENFDLTPNILKNVYSSENFMDIKEIEKLEQEQEQEIRPEVDTINNREIDERQNQEQEIRPEVDTINNREIGHEQEIGSFKINQSGSDEIGYESHSKENYDGKKLKLDEIGYEGNLTLNKQSLIPEFDMSGLEDNRLRTEQMIVQRQGQAGFREQLLANYGGRCPITGCDLPEALEAAHIVPYNGEQTNHPANGLPLRADIHTLFDLLLLSIEPESRKVVIAPALRGSCYAGLAGKVLERPLQGPEPEQTALAAHHRLFTARSGY